MQRQLLRHKIIRKGKEAILSFLFAIKHINAQNPKREQGHNSLTMLSNIGLAARHVLLDHSVLAEDRENVLYSRILHTEEMQDQIIDACV